MSISPRQLWIEALRSGEYEQGRGYLNKDGKMCCLGVACEVFQKHVGGLWITNQDDLKCYDSQSGCAPSKVASWLKLRTTTGSKANGLSLVTLNDKGTTFAEIADILEIDSDYFIPGH